MVYFQQAKLKIQLKIKFSIKKFSILNFEESPSEGKVFNC